MMLVSGFLLLSIAGALLVYLGNNNQRWLAVALSPWFSFGGGSLLMVAGLACALAHFSVITAICAALVLLMFCWGIFPLLSLLPVFPARSDARGRSKSHVH